MTLTLCHIVTEKPILCTLFCVSGHLWFVLDCLQMKKQFHPYWFCFLIYHLLFCRQLCWPCWFCTSVRWHRKAQTTDTFPRNLDLGFGPCWVGNSLCLPSPGRPLETSDCSWASSPLFLLAVVMRGKHLSNLLYPTLLQNGIPIPSVLLILALGSLLWPRLGSSSLSL